jgi:hypothetical protein
VDADVRVEKRKWNGAVSTVDACARRVPAPPSTTAWFVRRGDERARPSRASSEAVLHDELWVAANDDWWVLCVEADGSTIISLVLHAAAPLGPVDGDVVVWIDLDLDFEVRGDDVRLEDEAEFHRHAATMAYPPDVVRGAWGGISGMAARYTMGEWPFDGWLNGTLASVRASTDGT